MKRHQIPPMKKVVNSRFPGLNLMKHTLNSLAMYLISIHATVLAIVLGLGACTEKKPNPEIDRLFKMKADLEKSLKSAEGATKGAAADFGLKYKLTEDQELIKSRLERVVERLKELGVSGDAAGGGGGGAHH
jgi:hypothetical protein